MAESAASPDTQAPEEEPVEIVEFGLWWPAADPGKLREAAGAWDAMATHLDTATRTLSGAASAVIGANSGEAINAFAAHWDRIGGAQGALPAIAGDCRSMATSLREFADAVDEVREQITQMAIEIAATVAIGVGLAFFTFGASAGAAAGITSTMIARAFALCASLGARAATIISRVAVMGTLGAAEGMAANTIAQLGSSAIFNDNHNPLDGFSMGEVWTSGAFGFVGGGALGGLRSLRILRPGAKPPGVKDGWVSRPANNGQGTVYQRPGAQGNADMVRVAYPNSDYVNGYVRFYNKHGQPIGLDGKPGPNSATHIPRNPDGSYPLPEGW